MKLIDKLYLHALRNNEHYQFMTDVEKLIKEVTSEVLAITAKHPAFENALNALDDSLQVEKGSSKSAKLYELDKLRDKTWRAIKKRVDATTDSPVEEEVKSAYILQRVISLYGNIRKMSYNEESAAISNLVDDLQSEMNMPHVEQIGITTWVAFLKEQNQTFQEVFDQRNTELANRQSGDVRSARLIIDPLYKQIIDRINATITLDMAAEGVESFVNRLNEIIKYYQTQLAIRAGRNNNEEIDDDEV